MKVYTVGSGFGYTNNLHAVLYANGTTDYFEIYSRNSSNETIEASLRGSHFSAHLIQQA